MDMSSLFSTQTCLSVSELTSLATSVIENGLGDVQVEGEVSNFTASSAGHWYFTLKDSQSQVACAMFGANRYRKKLTTGDQIQVQARASIYQVRGTFQLIVHSYQQLGTGRLLQLIAERKYALEKEGLFDESNKKTLPTMCQHIGVITAESGAAITDIIQTCKRRSPCTSLYIYPSLVQGEGATQSIIDAIAFAQQHNQCEALIIGRGGGSLEDLMAYNDERLVRVVHACSIPIISAVGHERDFTLLDYVADKRASTPTMAAEILTLDYTNLIQQLDELSERSKNAMYTNFNTNQERLENLCARLAHPRKHIQAAQLQLQNHCNQMEFAMEKVLATHQRAFESYAMQLHQLNPKRILTRGFALVQSLSDTTNTSGKVITSANQARQTSQMEITFADGSVNVDLSS